MRHKIYMEKLVALICHPLLWGSGVGAVFVWVAVMFMHNYNPLPSDEEMIAYFFEHKKELGRLVKYYREYDYSPPERPFYTAKWERLKNKAGVGGVDPIGLWYQNPYTVESAKYINALNRAPLSKRITPEQRFPSRKYGGLSISLKDNRYHRSAFAMQKEFYFIPVVPKVSDGMLWFPVGLDGKLKEGYRALPSLNAIPEHWEVGDCVYRQIEPHWFIRMCHLAL